jgi:hypothetical protein
MPTHLHGSVTATFVVLSARDADRHQRALPLIIDLSPNKEVGNTTVRINWLAVANLCCRVPRGAWQLEAAGRRYGCVPAPGVCSSAASVWRAGGPLGGPGGGLRMGGAGETIRGNPWGYGEGFPRLVSPRCPAGLTGRAAAFLTSPPRVFMMGG